MEDSLCPLGADPEPAIVRAIKEADEETAIQLLRKNANKEERLDPNTRDTRGGWSILHMAALNDMAQTVSELIQLGADVNCDDGAGQTPLHYAVSWNSLEATRALVRGGANVGLTCRDRIYYINKTIPVCVVGGRTPLHIAAEKGYYECAKCLLDNGADPWLADLNMRTAYDLAVNSNRLDIASLLKPDVTEHVASLPKDDRLDRMAVEVRLQRNKRLIRPQPQPTMTPREKSELDDLLRRALELQAQAAVQQQQNSPSTCLLPSSNNNNNHHQ